MGSTGLDKVVGLSLMAIAGLVFTYYTLWVVILPFFDTGHTIQQFFLPRVYALAIPLVAGMVVLVALGLFATIVMMKKKAKTS